MHHFIVDILNSRTLENGNNNLLYTQHTIRFPLAEEMLLFSIIPKCTNF